MTLHPAQAPGSPAAIEVAEEYSAFLGHWVAEGVLLTNIPFTARHFEELSKAGVDTVLNLCEDTEYEPGERGEVEQAFHATGLREKRLPLPDFSAPESPDFLDRAVALVRAEHAAGRNVAVHCRGGRERSAMVVAAAVAAAEGLSGAEAIGRIATIAPQVSPLSHQRDALDAWLARGAATRA